METSLEWRASRICTRAYFFFIYINDLEEGVTGNILKFADDTKLFRKVKEIGDKQKLQDDIIRIRIRISLFQDIQTLTYKEQNEA